MPRTPALQSAFNTVIEGKRRFPFITAFMFDESDDLSAIVLNTYKQIPRNISSEIIDISISEGEDSAASAQINIKSNTLSPYNFIGRKIIKIFYNDVQAQKFHDTQAFPIFTGVTLGQPGYTRERSESLNLISVDLVDRSHFYNKRTLETPPFLTGVNLGTMALEIATNNSYGLGLQKEEVRFDLFNAQVEHTQVSIFDVPLMEGFDLIGFIMDKKPAFDGEGFFVMRDNSLTKPPARKYKDEGLFINIKWPKSNVEIFNRVEITGLSNVLSKVVSPQQELAEITGTLGYFQPSLKRRVNFTQDQRGRAQNVLLTKKVINGGLGKFLGGKIKIVEVTDFYCVVEITSPWMPYIFVAFFAIYITFFLLSAFNVFGIGDTFLIVAAIWLTVGLAVMQSIGTFEAVISGEPFNLVYKEIKSKKTISNLKQYEIKSKVFENHFIHDQALADKIACRELARELTKAAKREFVIPHDTSLEVSDIIELPDGTRYFITDISKRFDRNGVHDMQVKANMISSGSEVNKITGFPIY